MRSLSPRFLFIEGAVLALAFAAAAIVTTGGARAQGEASAGAIEPTHEAVRYGPRERNRLDLYLPDGDADARARPLVLFIHGGRWFRNDRSQIHRHDRAARLTEAGFAVASMDHTYSSEAAWPAQREDVAAALRFLSDAADRYGYDASRIAVWGQSSGAHLTLWALVLSARDEAPRVSAVVSWYAPSDLPNVAADREADAAPGGAGRSSEPSPEARLVGADSHETPANPADIASALEAASPLAAIRALPPEAELPTMLLVHGTADPVVSPRQTQRLYATVIARDPDGATLRLVKGGEHGGEEFDPVVGETIAFLEDALR